jgi:hypothetical protein
VRALSATTPALGVFDDDDDGRGGETGRRVIHGDGGRDDAQGEEAAAVAAREPAGGDHQGPVPALLQRDAVDAAQVPGPRRRRRRRPGAAPQLRRAAGPARHHRRVAGLLLLQLQDLQVGQPGHGDHPDPVAGQQRRVAGGPDEGLVVVRRPLPGVVGRGRRRRPARRALHRQLLQAAADGAPGLAAAAVRQGEQLGQDPWRNSFSCFFQGMIRRLRSEIRICKVEILSFQSAR